MNTDINTTPTKTGATNANAKKKVVAKNLKADDFVRLLRDIDSAVFQGDDNNLLLYNLAMCDVMVKYLELHYYFPTEFEKVEDFGEFFNDFFAGKYKDYVTAMGKTDTTQLIDKAVETRKQIAIGRLQNPLSGTLAKIDEILDTLSGQFKGIEANEIKRFINDFANFAQANNPETLTDALLNKKKSKG